MASEPDRTVQALFPVLHRHQNQVYEDMPCSSSPAARIPCLVKRLVQFLRGDIGTHLPQSNREIYLQSKVKIGFGIILIGASCPLFWFSFLSGVRGIALLFSSVSSLIVIVFGFAYMGFYRIQLRNELGTGKITGNKNANE